MDVDGRRRASTGVDQDVDRRPGCRPVENISLVDVDRSKTSVWSTLTKKTSVASTSTVNSQRLSNKQLIQYEILEKLVTFILQKEACKKRDRELITKEVLLIKKG